MHIVEPEAIMEHELAEAVQRHYPLDWKEDAITHDLLIRWAGSRSRWRSSTQRERAKR